MCTTSKSDLRILAREKLAKLSAFDRTFNSEMIVDDIIASGLLNEYASVLMYKSLPNEVCVDRLIEWATCHGKAVYLPRVSGDKIEVVKVPCQLSVGSYGVMEPLGDAVNVRPACVITPLLAVDKCGNRLGKGKGYYDKYFAENNTCYKVGVAFRQQLIDDITVSEFDVKLDRIFYR